MERYLIGVDIGTSGTKSILMAENGRVVASKTLEYPLYTPHLGWAEQDPEDWTLAAIASLQAIVTKANVPAETIVGLSFSGQMHGLVPLDKDDQVIRPAFLWCDQRTVTQCQEIVATAGGLSGLLSQTNNNMLTGYTGGKILWMRDEEPDNYAQMTHFLNPKDYVRYRLTGERMTEVSDASGVGFFDVEHRAWAWQLIDKLGLARSLFPACVESSDAAGFITREIAELTGLREGLPVFAGGGDAVIQTTGMGIITPGTLGLVIGTSGVVAMALPQFQKNDGRIQLFCNNAPGLWHAMGTTLSAGGSFRWYRDVFCKGMSYNELTGEAAEAKAGSVLFLPYLMGERCPYADPECRGTFTGMTLATTRADMTRSVMEGISMSLKHVSDVIGVSDRIIVSGGGALSPLWRQMLADLFASPVETYSGSGEGGAYGAALVAGVGAGVYRNLGEAVQVLARETVSEPNPEGVARYKDVYPIYASLHDTLAPAFAKIAKL